MTIAHIRGGPLAPAICGTLMIWEYGAGSWVSVAVTGLPEYRPGGNDQDPVGPHGFHLHERGDCSVGDPDDPFQAAGGHWDPDGQPHGNHAGDFPVLFSNGGVAISGFYTDRFRPQQAIGTAAIIHLHPDDYRTQPAGRSGPRLACGVVRVYSG